MDYCQNRIVNSCHEEDAHNQKRAKRLLVTDNGPCCHEMDDCKAIGGWFRKVDRNVLRGERKYRSLIHDCRNSK
eukprot:gene861-biopygen9334